MKHYFALLFLKVSGNLSSVAELSHSLDFYTVTIRIIIFELFLWFDTSFFQQLQNVTDKSLSKRISSLCPSPVTFILFFFFCLIHSFSLFISVAKNWKPLFFKRKCWSVHLPERFEVFKITFSSESPKVWLLNNAICYDLYINGQNRRCKLFEFFF